MYYVFVVICVSEVTNDEISISNALESNDEDDTEPTKQNFNLNRNFNNNSNKNKNINNIISNNVMNNNNNKSQVQQQKRPLLPSHKHLQPTALVPQSRSPFQYSEDDLESVTYVPKSVHKPIFILKIKY